MEKTQKNKPEINKYCVSVDGSIFSECAFEFVLNEIMPLGTEESIVAMHIKAQNQNSIPFKSQADSIYSYLESKFIGTLCKERYFIQILEEDKKAIHAIAQVYENCLKLGFNYMIVGFQGTSKKQKDEITKGMLYLISVIHLPCFIIKDYTPRKQKKTGGYVWLACIDNHGSKGWKAFSSACPFILDSDIVVCTHFSSSKEEKSLIEDEFIKHCDKFNIKNRKVDFPEYNIKKSVAQQIVDWVNYSDITPDFIIIGHNPGKYNNDTLSSSPAIEVMKKACTNVLFHS